MFYILLTFCVDIFGGGGFFSYSTAKIVSRSSVPSGMTVNSGASHRLFAIGSSYRKQRASNISRL